MKFIRLTIQYLGSEYGKRLLFLALMAIPGAFFLAIALPTGKFVGYFANILSGSTASYSALMVEMLPVSTWWGLLRSVLAVLAVTLSVSAMVKSIDRSMRVGVFKVRGLFRSINENFFPTLVCVLFMAVVLLLNSFLSGCFAALWLALSHNRIVTFVLSIVIALLLGFLVLLLFSGSMFTLPIMLTNGRHLLPSFQASLKQASPKYRKICFGVSLLFAVLLGFSFISALLAHNPVWRAIVDTLSYEVFIVLYVVLTYSAYYDLNGLERADLPAWEKHVFND